MRWFWIDRFLEFETGKRAVAVKNVSLAEDHLHDHFPGNPVMPTSLIVEGLAQTGGILLGEVNNFDHIVILAKVPKIIFHGWAVPGETLIYTADLTDARDEGGSVEVTAHVANLDGGDNRLIADGKIVFVHLNDNDPELGAIDQKNFVFESGLLNIFSADRDASRDFATNE